MKICTKIYIKGIEGQAQIRSKIIIDYTLLEQANYSYMQHKNFIKWGRGHKSK
jgi:hypothetical protein